MHILKTNLGGHHKMQNVTKQIINVWNHLSIAVEGYKEPVKSN